MGQTMRAVAAAAAWEATESPLSKEIREAISWLSDEGGVDVCELRERVLAEGDRCVLAGRGDGAAGESVLLLPSTLPPPRVLFDIFETTDSHDMG